MSQVRAAGTDGVGVELRVPHVIRQPVYDRSAALAGYELLLRGPDAGVADILADFALADLVGGRRCFVTPLDGSGGDGFRPGQASELGGMLRFAVEQCIVRMPANATVSEVSALAGNGYAVAVSGAAPADVLALAAYAVLDFDATAPDRVSAAVDACREHRHIRVVAAGLANRAHLAQARRLGCELFQGPALSLARPMSPARFRYLDLMAALTERDVDLARIVARDSALSFRLLRASAAVLGGDQRPSSISDVLDSLGPERARQWLALMLISDATEADEAQLAAVATGARFAQRIADHLGRSGESAFTAGLLVGLAELTGTPVVEFTDGLALAAEVSDAVRSGTGPLGDVLDVVRAYRQADLVSLGRAAVPAADLVRRYLRAAAWSTRTVAAVLTTTPGRPTRASA